MATATCDRYSITWKLAGVNSHETMSVVERAIGLCKLTALKSKSDAEREGLDISDDTLVAEAAMSANLMMSYGGTTPAHALLGYVPRDYYLPDGTGVEAHTGALALTPDPLESQLRMRSYSKANLQKAIVEERIARAHRSRQQKQQLEDLPVGSSVDL